MSRFPDHWRLVSLGEIGEFKNGVNKDKEDFGFGAKFVNLMDVFGRREIRDSDFGRVNVSAGELESYSLKAGDVLFVRSSVKPEGVGLTAVVAEDLADTVYSGFLIRYRHDEHLDRDYTRHCFYEAKFRRDLLARSTISANTNINQDSLRSLVIPLPPLPEQRKIAAILSTWDEAITLTERLIAALKARKQALMQLLLTGHKSLPHDWCWGRLSEFLQQDRTYVTSLEDKQYPRISVRWWAKGAVVDKYDNGADVRMKRHQLARAGQIIVSEIWAKHGSIGIIPVNGEGALITSHFYLYDFLPAKEASRAFIYALVNGNYFMRQADDASKGTTGYASIRASDFLNFKLPVPPIEEQQSIASVLETNEEVVNAYEAYLRTLQSQKRGLMQQLLTGAIRVQVEE